MVEAGNILRYNRALIEQKRRDAESRYEPAARMAGHRHVDKLEAERWVVEKVWPPQSEHNKMLSGYVYELLDVNDRTRKLYSADYKWEVVRDK